MLIGVRADGTKELITLADGYRESTESWADLLRDAKRRGMRALVLAVGDGALGFRRALREVSPRPGRLAAGSTRSRTFWPRCPKSAQLAAKNASGARPQGRAGTASQGRADLSRPSAQR